MRTIAWLLATFTALAGCMSDDHGLPAARARWESHHATDYQVTWEQDCFCPIESVRPMRITVTGGQVSSAAYVDDGKPVSSAVLSGLKTIDALFDQLKGQIDHGGLKVSVEYDPMWSFPSSVGVYPDPPVPDGGYSLTLSDFAPIAR